MTRDAEWRRRMLQECWDQKLNATQAAKHIGISRQMMYSILLGKEWRDVPRPKGFSYPFKYYPKKRVRTPEEKIRLILIYVEKRLTPVEFSELVGIGRQPAYDILKGYSWKDVERPPGFQYPWPGRFWSRRPLREQKLKESKSAAE